MWFARHEPNETPARDTGKQPVGLRKNNIQDKITEGGPTLPDAQHSLASRETMDSSHLTGTFARIGPGAGIMPLQGLGCCHIMCTAGPTGVICRRAGGTGADLGVSA